MDVIVSLGGSLIVPDKIDLDFLQQFKQIVEDFIRAGNRMVIITGGGHTCRAYQAVAKKLGCPTATDLDWIGIRTTLLNAETVRSIFGELAYQNIIIDPTAALPKDEKLLIGCGWRPGCSSDMDAVLVAENLGITEVINLTNTSHVFDKDPKEYPDAKPFEKMTWEQLTEIIGTEWVPGKNAPFDPKAAQKAKELGLTVRIMKGQPIENLQQFLRGEAFTGTTIHP